MEQHRGTAAPVAHNKACNQAHLYLSRQRGVRLKHVTESAARAEPPSLIHKNKLMFAPLPLMWCT